MRLRLLVAGVEGRRGLIVRAGQDGAPPLGARVMLAPREGPVGWRSVSATPAGGELALWQPKR
jgi:predicted enzyme related to lactoylglutathione lyase